MSYHRKRGPLGIFGIGKRKYRRRYDNNLSDLKGGGGFGLHWQINDETKKGIMIILLFVFSALGFLGLFDLSGEFGQIVKNLLSLALGGFNWLFPALALVFAYFLLRQDKYQVKIINYIGATLLVLGATGLWHLQFYYSEMMDKAGLGLGGGYLGVVLALPLAKAMGVLGAGVVCLAVFLIGLLLTFEMSIHGLMWPVKFLNIFGVGFKKIFLLIKNRPRREKVVSAEDDYEEEPSSGAVEEISEEGAGEAEPIFTKTEIENKTGDEEELEKITKPKKFGKKIELPLSLLISRSGKPSSGDIKGNQEIIKKTLGNFGIPVEMTEVNVGPTVTQYAFRPADGVKLSKIINLNSDLALALAAHPIRIEAPIPGRSLVGVEIPNQQAAKVTMNEILDSKEFKSRKNNLALAMGKDVSGKCYFADLTRMPHILIAGQTGSGKSVCINSIIVSLLYQNSPDELKFILVDPKRVELPIYDGIPYLLTPVITDVKKTISALKWTVSEMESRFELIAKTHKRNIEAYNQGAKDKLPYIVFIIDELADLMAAASNDVEAGIVRLAQMSRAVGIHLVLATQRPSVEVITGLIKANIPARTAFKVASLIDSRTILDSSGAEKLVGRGDMLYVGPDVGKPKRLQGVFLSDREIKNVVDFISEQGEAQYVEAVVQKQGGYGYATSGGGGFSDDGDSLMAEARETIRQSGKASASLLQRRLKIGYARAARILDLMEEQGIIGAPDGAKPREVFLDKLGGVNALEFAAREHDLDGELRPDDEFAMAEEEPSFTAFTRDEEVEEESSDEAVSDDFVQEEVEEEEKKADEAEEISPEEEEEIEEIIAEAKEQVEDEKIEAEAEEIEEVEEEEEEEEEKPVAKSSNKKTFDEDEWT